MSADPVAFAEARLAEETAEADPGVCGCYDANHVPSCIPTPWIDRALRDIGIRRAILAEHAPMEGFDGDRLDGQICRTCSNPTNDGDTQGDPYPCRTARLVLSRWAGHPDYRAEWAPADQGVH